VAAVAAQAPSTAQRSASAGTTLTLAQTIAAEKAALAHASSVRVVGRVVTRSGTFGVDLRVGANSIGTLRYAAGTVAIRRIGTALYLNADDAFYTGHGHPELLAEYHNRWMQIPADDPIYATVIPLTRLATWTTLPAAAAKVLHRGALVAGVPAVTVTGGTGPKASVLYLSAKAPILPLAAVSADKVDALAFLGWNVSDPAMSTPTGLVNEPDDTVLDVPTYPEATAQAFSVLWKP